MASNALRLPQLPRLAAPSTGTLLCSSRVSSAVPRRRFQCTHLDRGFSRAPRPLERHFATSLARPQQAGHNYNYYSDTPGQPPPLPRAQKPRFRWGIFLTVTCFSFVGVFLGLRAREMIAPIPRPEPGSPADEAILQVLRAKGARAPLVQELENDPGWVEIDARDHFDQDGAALEHRLLSGPLRGSRGVDGYYRVWYNPGLGVFATVAVFGAATAGWPGVVHGGLVGTVLGQELGWAPTVHEWGPSLSLLLGIDIDYWKPVWVDRFHVILTTRVNPDEAPRLDYKDTMAVVSSITELADVGGIADLLAQGTKPRARAVTVWKLVKKVEELPGVYDDKAMSKLADTLGKI